MLDLSQGTRKYPDPHRIHVMLKYQYALNYLMECSNFSGQGASRIHDTYSFCQNIPSFCET
jgi:hypothetical protein